MRFTTSTLFVLSIISSTTLSYESRHSSQLKPRSLDAILVEPQDQQSQSSESFLKHLSLRDMTPNIPFLKHLYLRQTTPAAGNAGAGTNAQTNAGAGTGAGTGTQGGAVQPAAGVAQGNAGANQAANAGTDPDAQQVAGGQAAGGAPAVAPAQAPAPVGAPVAGGGGGAAPAAPQPGKNAGQADPVTVITVQTVVGGVTKQVPQTYTQSFGLGGSAPPVQTGTIGMGTLTGKIGVVKTDTAKSEGMPIRDVTGKRWTILGIIGSWVAAMLLGGALIGARLI